MAKHRCLSEEALELVARRFAVLSEPMRLRLIQSLFDGERNVSQLVDATEGTQANVSRHLQTLTAAGILERRKDGLQVYYRISDPTIPQLCGIVCTAIEKQLARQTAHFAGSE
jgi:ArsR family transcriptional regulator